MNRQMGIAPILRSARPAVHAAAPSAAPIGVRRCCLGAAANTHQRTIRIGTLLPPPRAAAAAESVPTAPDSGAPASNELDDDGSEGSGAQHGPIYSDGAWCESEETRAYRRTSFTFADWKKHRSNRRYIYHLSTLAA